MRQVLVSRFFRTSINNKSYDAIDVDVDQLMVAEFRYEIGSYHRDNSLLVEQPSVDNEVAFHRWIPVLPIVFFLKLTKQCLIVDICKETFMSGISYLRNLH